MRIWRIVPYAPAALGCIKRHAGGRRLILIAGGGVAGAALARALVLRGAPRVTVWDPNPPGTGSTGRALGGFRTQFATPLNIRLSLASRPYFAARAGRIRFRSVGYLYTASDEARVQALRMWAEIQRSHGLPIEHPEWQRVVPHYRLEHVLVTNYCALDGRYYPPAILEAMIEEAQAAGAGFCYRQAPSRAALEGADTVVIAAGIWSPQVAADLGVTIEVRAEERDAWMIPVEGLPESTPVMIDASEGWACREREGKLLVISPDGVRGWEPVRAWLQEHVPSAATEPAEHWTGCYEVTPDQHPLVGETERRGVWASCGFSGHGIMHAPAIAESLAAMILGDTPPLDIADLSPRRTQPLHDPTQV